MWCSAMLPKTLTFFLMLTFFSVQSHAVYIALLIGPKSETYTEKLQVEKNRLNPASILFEIGSKVYNKWYLTGSASGEFDVSNISTVGFGLNAFAKYYFIGSPETVHTVNSGTKMKLSYPYSFFGGLGLFQKNLRFSDRAKGDIDENLGGLGLTAGGTYSLRANKFLISQIQYLSSGSDSDKTYSSIELYFGIGMRF